VQVINNKFIDCNATVLYFGVQQGTSEVFN